MNIRGAIFDLDGTLTDSMYIWQKAPVDLMRRYGGDPPEDLARDLKEMGRREAAEYLRSRFSLSTTPEELMDTLNDLVTEEYRSRVPLKPGADRLLARLADSGISCCIATASEAFQARSAMERLGLWPHFRFAVSCVQYGGKTRPDIYLEAGWVPLAGTADVVTAATPLAYMKTGDMAGLTSQYSVTDMFLGNIGGSLGEISALLLIVGGAYLIWRKVISWQTPAAYIATVAVLTFLFPKGGADNLQFMLYSIFGGGLMLGAFFMATDYTTSPVTKTGQLIFGLGCGLLTVFIRYFGSYPEGVCYSIMIMNLVVALIDKAVKPSRFGVVKSANKEAAAK